MEFTAGAELGGYRLISLIGAGGMGQVWRAEDKRLGRLVAIKILPVSIAADAEARARLEREARTAAQLYHPSIATIHSLDEAHGRAFIVMEYVEGEPLSHAIERGRMSEAEVCRIGRNVADALAEAHERGIIHRDIKPDNIVLSGNRVKVLDFGIAKRIGPLKDPGANTSQALTEAGMILGTVQYMSPEQALGRQLDGRTDIFSLGVVLYQMLTGRLPFVGESITDVLAMIIRDEAPDVTAALPGTNRVLAQVVRRCLQKEREKRYESAAAVRDALDAVMPTAGSIAGAGSKTERYVDPNAATVITGAKTLPERAVRRAPGMIIAAASALLLIIAASLFSYQRNSVSHVAPSVAVTPAAVGSPSTAVDVVAPATVVETTASAPVTPAPLTEPLTASTSQPAAAAVVASAPPTATIAPEKPVPERDGAATLAESSYRTALGLIEAGRQRAAMVALQKTINIDAAHAPARLRMGALLLAGGRKELARAEFSAALRNSSRLDARETMLAKTGAAIAAGDLDRAAELAGEFQTRWPDDPDLLRLTRAGEDRSEAPRPGPRRGRRRN